MLENCRLCDNCIKRHNVVKGIGNIDAKIMFVFDHPRMRQDKTGLFVSDPNMNKLIGYLSDHGFNEFNSYFTFLVKCRPLTIDYLSYKNISICANNHLSKEYNVGNYKKQLIVTVGPLVANYMLAGKQFKYFTPYRVGSALIVIPGQAALVKGNDSFRRKLSIIKDVYDRLNIESNVSPN